MNASRRLPYTRYVSAQGLLEPVSGVEGRNLSGTAGDELVSNQRRFEAVFFVARGQETLKDPAPFRVIAVQEENVMNHQKTATPAALLEVASRIRELREVSGFTVEEMALQTDVTEEEYHELLRLTADSSSDPVMPAKKTGEKKR